MPVLSLINESSKPPRKLVSYNGQSVDIDVNNDDFLTDQDAVENIIIDNENLTKLLVHIHNKHASNGLSYQIIAHAENVDTPPALAEPPEAWFEVPNGSGNIAAENADAFILTDNWRWVVVQLKRQVAAADATADVFIRAD